jgi:CheY-like chemotaxis protein
MLPMRLPKSALGHQVKVAYDGKTALQFTSVETFDVVFLDIELPDSDGRDLCRTIRNDGASRDASIIAIIGPTELRSAELEPFNPSCAKALKSLRKRGERYRPRKENVTTQRARVLARMATTSSVLNAEVHEETNSENPSSSQSRTAIVARSIRPSLVERLFTSPNAQIVTASLMISVILGPRPLITAAAVPVLLPRVLEDPGRAIVQPSGAGWVVRLRRDVRPRA